MSAKGSSNKDGTQTRVYNAGEELETIAPWQKNLAQQFIDLGFAVESAKIEIDETKDEAVEIKPKAKRAYKTRAK